VANQGARGSSLFAIAVLQHYTPHPPKKNKEQAIITSNKLVALVEQIC